MIESIAEPRRTPTLPEVHDGMCATMSPMQQRILPMATAALFPRRQVRLKVPTLCRRMTLLSHLPRIKMGLPQLEDQRMEVYAVIRELDQREDTA